MLCLCLPPGKTDTQWVVQDCPLPWRRSAVASQFPEEKRGKKTVHQLTKFMVTKITCLCVYTSNSVSVLKWILHSRFQGGTTDLWRANLDPVRFHSVEVLAMYSYYMRVTRKRSWEVRDEEGEERTLREMERWRARESVQFLKCHIYKTLSGFLIVVPVLRRAVPESSYTVTCLPLQTVTEACRYDNTHPVNMISISVFTSRLHGQIFVEAFSIFS